MSRPHTSGTAESQGLGATGGGRNVEMELADLHRRYRIMEGDRKSYSEESQNVIRKQRGTIEKLKKENEYLKEELAQVESQRVDATVNKQASATMTKLQEQADNYAKKVETERSKISELDKQIRLLNRRIFEQRSEMGGVNAAREKNQQIQRQIKVLENRLDKALVKFNEALSNNKKLREQIDTLRRERVVFDGIYKKLEKQLMDKKKDMATIIEISNAAYEARDEAQNRMIQLKEKADKEIAAFDAEIQELSRVNEQDRKMKDFMKLREGAGDDKNKKKKKGGLGAWEFANARAATQLSIQRVQTYEEGFAKIQAATGISEIDEFVNTFIKVEDQNFSLFNYVNELNNEIEKLDEQINEIKTEIEKYKSQGINTDNQRKKILKDLDERLLRTEAKSEQYEAKYNSTMKIVVSLKNGINSIFNRIGCNNNAISEMLGNQGVNESNMMQYLGIIEQRTNEILQQYAALQLHSSEMGAHPTSIVGPVLGQGPAAPVGSTTFNINPPTTGEEYDSEDDSEDEEEERPLTREELKTKTLRRLNKRDATGRPKKQKKPRDGPKRSPAPPRRTPTAEVSTDA